MGLADWKNEFDSASPRRSSDYMKQGNFLLRIDQIAEGKNSKKQDNFKVEGTIIHVMDAEGTQSVGQSVTDMYSSNNLNYAEDLKVLVAGMFGMDPDEISFEDHLLPLIDDKQPLKGAVVEYYVYDKPTKSGGLYTICQCRGFQPEAAVRGKLSDAEWERFGDSLIFNS